MKVGILIRLMENFTQRETHRMIFSSLRKSMRVGLIFIKTVIYIYLVLLVFI